MSVIWRPVFGCPRLTTLYFDRYNAVAHKRSELYYICYHDCSAIWENNNELYCTPKVLDEGIMYVKVPRVSIPLTGQSRKKILKWFREHVNWAVSDCCNVLFTVESRIALDKMLSVLRFRKNETHIKHKQVKNIIEQTTFRGGSAMVWAGI